MLVIGVDTSFSYISLGLADEDGIKGEMNLWGEINTAFNLFPSLRTFLDLQGLDLKKIDGFAVGIGPGSFTGLRIALTLCKTLSYFTGKPVKGVSSLLALSYPLPNDRIKAVAVPAYGGEVYAGVYRDKSPLFSDMICSLSNLLSILEEIREPVYFAYHPSLQVDSFPHNIIPVELLFPPRGGIIAQLGREFLIKGESDNPLTLEPNYLRPSQAERRLYG
ncbi:tRNA (adenosine(37)-N6)-threonylcarbamoyltransferase complex dimerization subunit type 1 TsaB [bacterium]|nr:tRNA (adenosine(37)-N6)-threonylcarbamoyltransferase complex dimerization subunit type 1 TsaB [bacterium]